LDRFLSHLKQPFTSVWLCSGFILGCFITLYTANTAVFYLISFAVILAAAYFKPFLPILSGFICGIFLVFFHYLVFYSQSECDLRPKKPVIANFQVISIHSAQSPFYVKASLKSIQGCSLSILKPPLAMISVSTAQKLMVGDEVSAQIKLKPFRSVKNYNSFDRERHAFRQRLFYKGRTVSKIQIENQTGKPTSTEVELLMHERFSKLVETIKEHYDLIIIDTPPILAVTDPAIVSAHAGSTLLVTRFGQNHVRELELTRNRFEQNGIDVKGVVFNGILKKASNSYGYYGYYNYEYKSGN
jgi:hypothetical protein